MIESIETSKCTGCGICVDVCPLDTLRLDAFTNKFPSCRQACPAGVDIRGFIYYLKQDMIEEAARLIAQSLPYPAIIGRLCTHPCEKACARKKVDDPLNIRGLERYVGEYLLGHKLDRFPVRHAAKVAVIGSGPVGMAVAYYIRRMGYVTTIFEKQDHVGGSFIKAIREGQLKGELFESEIERFEKHGVVFSVNNCLSKNVGIDELKDMRYEAIFLAWGITKDLASMQDYKNTQGLFFKQDLLIKEMPLIKAIGIAKDAAIRIDDHLQGKDSTAASEEKPDKVLNIPRNGIYPRPRREKENGFDEMTAEEEASRCMSCGSQAIIAYPEDCMTCYDCEVQCPVDAIKVHPFKEVLPLSLALNNTLIDRKQKGGSW